ncbi:uncharacterized protein TRIADDRAFT_62538 [Trichoplax adhaerens]|uniref:Uncharacterized protein n=1 Tax=Trichoplax adhaerens TaxID=10228 RepID=B3SE34_TRIAD|nr:predicted protein [Trichoplax adhaerens]EDV19011.1 predicted protein [Trichoplax adhaerens]|eukprot:XP_002118503.1 predicted protein [Trichoplax adhaerens]
MDVNATVFFNGILDYFSVQRFMSYELATVICKIDMSCAVISLPVACLTLLVMSIERYHAVAIIQFRSVELSTVGDNVAVRIPDVDRAKGDHRNLIAVVLERTAEGYYRLGTSAGILKSLYSIAQFESCEKHFMSLNDVYKNNQVSLRQAATFVSVGKGQGVFHRNCKRNCSSKICKCRASMVLCNSRCHQSMPCTNKG